MATIQDFEERIEKQKAELAKLEAKKKELEKKIRERNRKWSSLVTHSAGESVLSAVGCAWQELDLDALDRFLASHADEVSDMLTAHGSTPEDAKARLDARKKKTVKTEPVADGGLQAAEPDSENSDWEQKREPCDRNHRLPFLLPALRDKSNRQKGLSLL